MTDAKTYHETRFTPHAARAQVWRHVVGYLAERWPELRGSVAELGAGYCDFINQLPARTRYAVDLWPELPRRVAPGVTALVQDATAELPPDLDAVFASNLLEHLSLDDARICLANVRRSLRPGGVLLCMQPNFRLAWRRYFDDFTHKTIFTDVSLADFGESCGFEPCHVAARFLPLTMKSSAGRLTFLVPLYLRSPVKPLAGQMLVAFRKPAPPA
jgi:SAM-dependent methyltransferase